jgi:serine/threonine protein kinase
MTCPSCRAENEGSALACTACGVSLAVPTTILVSVDLKAGALFHSRYEIVGPLGRGGMGMVYKARDRTLDELVAIKVLRPDFAQDPRMADRFKSEIKLARRVRHRNVCCIHDYGEDQGLLYISMELIGGVDLKRILRENGPLPTEKAYDVAIQVAEGLQAVHDAGVIHRDLKSPNIMLDPAGVARLMDFGVAKRSGDGSAATTTGQILGTPEYMSPEQAQGKRVDFRSDIYALGIVTYEIFSGRVPFHGETPISTILKHLHDAPPLEGPQATGIPPDLKPALRRMLAKDAADRYATATQCAAALRAARSPSQRQQPLGTEELVAPTLVHWPTLIRSRRRVWGGILTAAVLLPVGFLLLHRTPVPLVSPTPGLSPEPVVTTTLVGRPRGADEPLVVRDETAPPLAATTMPLAAAAAAPVPRPRGAAPSLASGAGAEASGPVATQSASRKASPSPAKRENAAPVAAAALPVPTPATAAPTPEPAPVGQGLLQIAVKPWGDVSVDGRALGSTPLDKVQLATGPHTVSIRHPAYAPIERRVTIRSGQTEKLIVDFPAEGVRQ